MSAPLRYKGRPVPYITAWRDEKVPQPPVMATQSGLVYVGTRAGQDETGLLWRLWDDIQGSGEPLWSDVHAGRQQQAMRQSLCQVCGGPADRSEQGVLWLLEDGRAEGPQWPNGFMTTHPPICVPCAPVAARLCPHLQREGAVPVRVRTAVYDAVIGLRYFRSRFGLVAAQKKEVVLMNAWTAKWVVAGQLVASLDDCTVLDPAEVGIEAPAPRGGFRR
ncbi:hypothetical protein AB0958_18560 [Streptomyces sp. NPDC006655]|uniref:hypothetical protein n=1 Tax=Streptomyces sp. NPDC006655 TaxID=3156898 RepID=UPI003452A2BE